MSYRDESARHRADSLTTERGDGLGADGVTCAPSHGSNYTCSERNHNRAGYSKAEADRRGREACYRIERQREQQQAARYFCQLQRGCVRRV